MTQQLPYKVGIKTFISIDFEADYDDDGRGEIFWRVKGWIPLYSVNEFLAELKLLYH